MPLPGRTPPPASDRGREFLRRQATIPKPHQVKVYCIVGYPTETEDDWCEFVEDLSSVDSTIPRQKQWQILLHCTPFRAMPATPAATWEMSLKDYRGQIARRLKAPTMPGNVFYQGNAFWAVEGMGTDSLPTVIDSVLCLRGIEKDAEKMSKLACSPRYWGAPTSAKLATLERYFDVGRLFGAYAWDTLPTKYLNTYVNKSTIQRFTGNKAVKVDA